MKRTPLRRRPKPATPRAARPGVTPKMPKGWDALCYQIRGRDDWTCRRCRRWVTIAHVNHVIPRRICEDLIVEPVNLATLCETCHGWATAILEPKLYAGDVQAFAEFLKVLARSGPIPDEAMRAAAYQRIRELQA